MPTPKIEQALILDACFALSCSATIEDLARDLVTSRLDALMRVAQSEPMEMVGLDCAPGSEQEAEFFGLALAGVPLCMALKWCSATEATDERPTEQELACAMTAPDLRAALMLASEAGVAVHRDDQLLMLQTLVRRGLAAVRSAATQLSGANKFAMVDADHVARLLEGGPSLASLPTVLGDLCELDDHAFTSPSMGQRAGSASRWGSKPTKKAASTRGGKGRRWGGKRRGASRGASYPTGGPAIDRRTPAEKAWETRTHW